MRSDPKPNPLVFELKRHSSRPLCAIRGPSNGVEVFFRYRRLSSQLRIRIRSKRSGAWIGPPSAQYLAGRTTRHHFALGPTTCDPESAATAARSRPHRSLRGSRQPHRQNFSTSSYVARSVGVSASRRPLQSKVEGGRSEQALNRTARAPSRRACLDAALLGSMRCPKSAPDPGLPPCTPPVALREACGVFGRAAAVTGGAVRGRRRGSAGIGFESPG